MDPNESQKEQEEDGLHPKDPQNNSHEGKNQPLQPLERSQDQALVANAISETVDDSPDRNQSQEEASKSSTAAEGGQHEESTSGESDEHENPEKVQNSRQLDEVSGSGRSFKELKKELMKADGVDDGFNSSDDTQDSLSASPDGPDCERILKQLKRSRDMCGEMSENKDDHETSEATQTEAGGPSQSGGEEVGKSSNSPTHGHSHHNVKGSDNRDEDAEGKSQNLQESSYADQTAMTSGVICGTGVHQHEMASPFEAGLAQPEAASTGPNLTIGGPVVRPSMGSESSTCDPLDVSESESNQTMNSTIKNENSADNTEIQLEIDDGQKDSSSSDTRAERLEGHVSEQESHSLKSPGGDREKLSNPGGGQVHVAGHSSVSKRNTEGSDTDCAKRSTDLEQESSDSASFEVISDPEQEIYPPDQRHDNLTEDSEESQEYVRFGSQPNRDCDDGDTNKSNEGGEKDALSRQNKAKPDPEKPEQLRETRHDSRFLDENDIRQQQQQKQGDESESGKKSKVSDGAESESTCSTEFFSAASNLQECSSSKPSDSTSYESCETVTGECQNTGQSVPEEVFDRAEVSLASTPSSGRTSVCHDENIKLPMNLSLHQDSRGPVLAGSENMHSLKADSNPRFISRDTDFAESYTEFLRAAIEDARLDDPNSRAKNRALPSTAEADESQAAAAADLSQETGAAAAETAGRISEKLGYSKTGVDWAHRAIGATSRPTPRPTHTAVSYGFGDLSPFEIIGAPTSSAVSEVVTVPQSRISPVSEASSDEQVQVTAGGRIYFPSQASAEERRARFNDDIEELRARRFNTDRTNPIEVAVEQRPVKAPIVVRGKLEYRDAVCRGFLCLIMELTVNLDSITHLDLVRNRFASFDGLHYFKNLTELILTRNRISDNGILELDKNVINREGAILPTLKKLDLSFNFLSDLVMLVTLLSNESPNLEYLNLVGNVLCGYRMSTPLEQVRDPIYRHDLEKSIKRYRLYVLSSLKKLTYLDYKPVTEKERTKAKWMQNKLYVVDLENGNGRNEVLDVCRDGAHIEFFFPWTPRNITELNLSDQRVRNLSAFANYPNLRTLILDRNKLTDEQLSTLPVMNQLSILSLNQNRLSNFSVVLKILELRVKYLTYLSLLGNLICGYWLLPPRVTLTPLPPSIDPDDYSHIATNAAAAGVFVGTAVVDNYAAQTLRLTSEEVSTPPNPRDVPSFSAALSRSALLNRISQMGAEVSPKPPIVPRHTTLSSDADFDVLRTFCGSAAKILEALDIDRITAAAAFEVEEEAAAEFRRRNRVARAPAITAEPEVLQNESLALRNWIWDASDVQRSDDRQASATAASTTKLASPISITVASKTRHNSATSAVADDQASAAADGQATAAADGQASAAADEQATAAADGQALVAGRAAAAAPMHAGSSDSNEDPITDRAANIQKPARVRAESSHAALCTGVGAGPTGEQTTGMASGAIGITSTAIESTGSQAATACATNAPATIETTALPDEFAMSPRIRSLSADDWHTETFHRSFPTVADAIRRHRARKAAKALAPDSDPEEDDEISSSTSIESSPVYIADVGNSEICDSRQMTLENVISSLLQVDFVFSGRSGSFLEYQDANHTFGTASDGRDIVTELAIRGTAAAAVASVGATAVALGDLLFLPTDQSGTIPTRRANKIKLAETATGREEAGAGSSPATATSRVTAAVTASAATATRAAATTARSAITSTAAAYAAAATISAKTRAAATTSADADTDTTSAAAATSTAPTASAAVSATASANIPRNVSTGLLSGSTDGHGASGDGATELREPETCVECIENDLIQKLEAEDEHARQLIRYRVKVLRFLPHLRHLDHKAITGPERELSWNVGADIYPAYLPERLQECYPVQQPCRHEIQNEHRLREEKKAQSWSEKFHRFFNTKTYKQRLAYEVECKRKQACGLHLFLEQIHSRPRTDTPYGPGVTEETLHIGTFCA